MKIIFHIALAVTMAMSVTGCCTAELIDTFKQKTADTFNPTTVYQSTNRETFALGGVRDNNPAYSRPPFQTFVMISQKSFASANLQTNENLSLVEIKKLPPNLTLHLKSKNKLPSNFEKIADLPKNDVHLEIKEHHPGRAVIMFIPFTFACDVLTFPFQVLIFSAMGHGC